MTRPSAGALVAATLLAAVLVAAPGAPIAALEPPPAPAVELQDAFVPPRPPPSVAAYLLMDADTGQVIAGTDADARRPVASTIKVLTALSVLERAELDDEVLIGEEVVGVPGSSVELEPGQTWTVAELIDGLIVRSGNDAAEALAVHVAGDTDAFLRLMEADARQLGLGELSLASVSGLSDDNLLSAEDLATISRAALDDPRLRPVLASRSVTLPSVGEVATRNELLLLDPTATGVKTGFTTAAGPSLVASAERDGRSLLAVVLGADADPARFLDAQRLLDHAAATTRRTSLTTDLEVVVAGGHVRYLLDELLVTVPDAAIVDVDVRVPDRPTDAALAAALRVDDVVHAELTMTRVADGVTVADGAAAIGHGAADGIYAALRAATRSDRLR